MLLRFLGRLGVGPAQPIGYAVHVRVHSDALDHPLCYFHVQECYLDTDSRVLHDFVPSFGQPIGDNLLAHLDDVFGLAPVEVGLPYQLQ